MRFPAEPAFWTADKKAGSIKRWSGGVRYGGRFVTVKNKLKSPFIRSGVFLFEKFVRFLQKHLEIEIVFCYNYTRTFFRNKIRKEL